MKNIFFIVTFSQNEGIAHKNRSSIPTFLQKSGIEHEKHSSIATVAKILYNLSDS